MITLVSSVRKISGRIGVSADSISDGLLHLLKAKAAADAGPMAEQLLRLVFGGHQHQPPLAVDACLQPRPRSQAEGIAQGPRDGELTLGGESDGVYAGIVRRVALPFASLASPFLCVGC